MLDLEEIKLFQSQESFEVMAENFKRIEDKLDKLSNTILNLSYKKEDNDDADFDSETINLLNKAKTLIFDLYIEVKTGRGGMFNPFTLEVNGLTHDINKYLNNNLAAD